MDEIFAASDRVLKKAAEEKQVPWCSIFLVSVIMMSHTLVLIGNLETASAFSSIGLSTAGWSGVGIELATSLEHELEKVLTTVADMLTKAIGEIASVTMLIDMITGFQSQSIDVVMSSQATKALVLLEAHGIMNSEHVGGLAGLITKSMTTSTEKMTGTIKDAIKSLLDKLKPALIQVGKFIIKFGEKVQSIIESFSVSLDRAQKAFDQVMSSMQGGGKNIALMEHQTYHMFDTRNTGSVGVIDLQNVARLYNVPALQGAKSADLVKKYDRDKDGVLAQKEFYLMIHDPQVPNLLSVVLRSFAKSLAQVAGQVGGAKFRGEIANDVSDYLELMTAKNHTEVDWICDHLGNGSLPLPFTADLLIALALKVDDPNTHKSVPTGAYVVNQLMKLHPKQFGRAMDQVTNATYFTGQGYSPDTHAEVVKRVTGWSTKKDPYAGLLSKTSLAQADEESSDEAAVGADGAVDVDAPTMMMERKLVETMEQLAYKVAAENMHTHLSEIEEEHRRLNDQLFGSESAQFLLLHMMGGQRASVSKGNPNDPAAAATKSQIPALPSTLQFAKWLSWNATHTAKLFNEWSFTYQKTSSNAIDAFATQVQAMVKKIQGFIKMMMKYSTPDGIDQLENTLIDYAEAQLKAMLFVTKKRVGVLMDDAFAGLPKPSTNAADNIEVALAGQLVQLAPAVATELRKVQNQEANGASETEAGKEITKLLEEVSLASLSSVSASLEHTVEKTSFLHIEVGKGVRALHAEGMGSVDRALMAELEADVNTALQQAQVKGPGGDAVGDAAAVAEALVDLVEDAIMLLNALNHALPQASKALIFAKKEVSMLSKTLENIFKVLETTGPKIFNEIDYYYAYIWKMYYLLMITLPCSLLFYAFWSGGFFGGPGTRVDQPRVRRPNALAKLCGCIEDCCRCCCAAHEWQGYGGAELCFWSVCLFLQFVVLMLFIMAILITIIAAVQFFLASGCAQIYLLGDQSICGNVLGNLRLFLDTIFPGLTNFPNHCINKNLLMCELIGSKMASAAEYTVVGSFMAATFTFQMIIESGQLHSRALTRIRFEHVWAEREAERNPDAKKK